MQTAADTNPTPSDRRIRTPNERDVNFVYSLQNKMTDYVGYTPKGGLIDRIQTGRLLIVEENGSPAGYITYTHRKDGRTHLPQVAVHPDLWRTAFGSTLLARIVSDARKQGSYAITLKSAIDLPANLFWPRFGFIPQRIEPTNRRTLIHWALPLRPHSDSLIIAPKRARPPNGIISRRQHEADATTLLKSATA